MDFSRVTVVTFPVASSLSSLKVFSEDQASGQTGHLQVQINSDIHIKTPWYDISWILLCLYGRREKVGHKATLRALIKDPSSFPSMATYLPKNLYVSLWSDHWLEVTSLHLQVSQGLLTWHKEGEVSRMSDPKSDPKSDQYREGRRWRGESPRRPARRPGTCTGRGWSCSDWGKVQIMKNMF